MKAVGYKQPLPISDPESLLDIEVPQPQPGVRDLLVEVKAISVNPVDVKMRVAAKPDTGTYKILGWDAAGVVRAIGAEASLFKPGAEVFYSGSISRQGTNAEFHAVDERIVGHKPRTLTFHEAAALPLTSITAWELLFDRLGLKHESSDHSGTLLIVGAAGGVGSILTQLARKLTGLTIVATASDAATRQWCLDMGAHEVIDHFQPIPKQLRDIKRPVVEYIASLTATASHYPVLAEVLAPQGKLGVIDDPNTLDATLLKPKCASLHWEYMFARSFFETPDMIEQHNLLDRIAKLVDDKTIRTTIADTIGKINAANLKKAHALLESGKGKGKIVLEGF